MMDHVLTTIRAHRLRLALTAMLIAGASLGSVQAGQEKAVDVADLHSSWRDCLHRTFGFHVALTSKTLAADTALRACRLGEEAYLTALSTSPLIDGDDVARVRPALLERARGWLLNGRASRPL